MLTKYLSEERDEERWNHCHLVVECRPTFSFHRLCSWVSWCSAAFYSSVSQWLLHMPCHLFQVAFSLLPPNVKEQLVLPWCCTCLLLPTVFLSLHTFLISTFPVVKKLTAQRSFTLLLICCIPHLNAPLLPPPSPTSGDAL